MKTCLSPLLLAAALATTASADVVTNTLDSGPGSLRQVFEDHLRSNTGTITFAPELSGQTITLGSELYIGPTFNVHPIVTTTVVMDGSSVPGGVTINGGGHSIFTAPAGTNLTLQDLTLTGGGGVGTAAITNLGSLQLTGCTFTGNPGTVVLIEMGTATVDQCTFAGNSGSAIENVFTGSVTLTHCTVSGNTSGLSNGYRYSSMKVVNCIIAGNTTVDVSNAHFFTREGANIITSFVNNQGDGVYPASDGGPPAITGAPLLAPLGNYGGPTKTMALLPGSPARDAAVGSAATADQRGFPINGTADIGAYEAGSATNFNAWIYETLPAAATAAQHDAAFDFDGDGQSNSDEFVFLTNPGSSISFFALSFTREGESLRLSFPSVPGRHYTLQQNDTLAAAWTSAPGQPPLNGDGTAKSFLAPLTSPRQFFRVQAGP